MRAALAVAGVALCAGSGAAYAQAGTSATDLSFEQLGAMEVSGVSKSAERLLDAPAAVTVITADEIRAFGYRTLAEVLNSVPGYYPSSEPAYGYTGVRGFGPLGGVNSRILLLIDGFPTNDNFFEQALTGNEAIFDIDLVDRIEIIHGPGSSIYGANAFFGVINVIMKSPAQENTGAKAWVGSGSERGASATVAQAPGEGLQYFLRATEYSAQGLDVVFPSQPALPGGARYQGLAAYDVTRAFAKVIDGNLRINVGFSERRQGAGYGLHGDVAGDPRSWARDGDTFADAHYDGSNGNDTDYVLRASIAEYRYDAEIVDDPAAPNALPATSDWIDTEATATHRFSAQNRLVVGLELRRDLRESMTQSNSILGTFQRIDVSTNRFGLYAQSDVDWSEHWASSLGVRLDRNDGVDRTDPRVALLWKPTTEQVVKLMVGTAFRQPSAFERYFAQPGSFLSNPDLASERVRTADLEYEAQLNPDSRVSITVFHYRAIDLIDTVFDPVAGTVQYQNVATAEARGADLALEQRLTRTTQLHLSASYASASDDSGNWLQNSPHWSGRVGVDEQLPKDWRLGVEGLYGSSRLAYDGSTVPGFVIANAVVSTTPRRGRPDFSFGVYNLLDRSYALPYDFVPRINEPGRTWRVMAGYSF